MTFNAYSIDVFLFIIFYIITIFITIIMLNLLISIIGNSHDKIKDFGIKYSLFFFIYFIYIKDNIYN